MGGREGRHSVWAMHVGRARYGNSGSGQGKAGIKYNAGRGGMHGGQLWQSRRAKQALRLRSRTRRTHIEANLLAG